jgi:hypothetical protein
MRRKLWHNLIGALLFAASSSCCEQQWNHSVRRMWADYNTFRAPALSFEQVDHLPYPAAQVGYYRWMYDKDPGHQLAALGTVTPPVHVVPQCVPPNGDPFEYQVAFPTAIPYPTDPLWGKDLPEPINVPHGQPTDGLNAGPSTGKESPDLLTVPMAPVLPPASSDLKRPDASRTPVPPNRAGLMPADPSGAPPGFESAPPPPRPVDEDVLPLLGPSSQQDPNLRLTTGQPASSPAPSGNANAIWPR